jgi:predicted anti-sigma-YlaC factor YlaD
MNCALCQNELEAYLEGRLPDGIRVQVESHLAKCDLCAEAFQLIQIAEKVMNEEKGEQSNPFLVTRIMAEIEALEQTRRIPVYQKVLKPVLISVSIAAAILVGVVSGNIYKPTHTANTVPVEMSYMNDAALESVDMFVTNK